MSGRDAGSTDAAGSEPPEPVELQLDDSTIEQTPIPFELEVGSKRSQEYQPPPPPADETPQVTPTVGDEQTQVRPPVEQAPPGVESSVTPEQGLIVRLLDDVEFYAGETPTLRVLVTNRDGQNETPVANAAVSIKVLGTAFRPLLYSLKSQKDGIATVSTQIPQFTSGRAAVLIKASSKDRSAEVRCIIHPNR